MRSTTPDAQHAEGLLSVVGTPIGNMEDITLRALRTLGEADCVVAEDTRHTRALLARHELARPLESMHAHSADSKIEQLVERLRDGAHLALVSDAGCPVLSDPGGRLVSAARDAGIRVETIPGPSAVTASLAVAGMRAETFRFVGFLPRTGSRRKRALQAIAADTSAVVLFESPRRLLATIRELSLHLGDRRLAVCRELTKLHEEVARGTADELLDHFSEGVRGEITLLIEARDATEDPREDLSQALESAREALARGERIKDVAKRLAAATQLSGQEAYARLDDLRKHEK